MKNVYTPDLVCRANYMKCIEIKELYLSIRFFIFFVYYSNFDLKVHKIDSIKKIKKKLFI